MTTCATTFGSRAQSKIPDPALAREASGSRRSSSRTAPTSISCRKRTDAALALFRGPRRAPRALSFRGGAARAARRTELQRRRVPWLVQTDLDIAGNLHRGNESVALIADGARQLCARGLELR